MEETWTEVEWDSVVDPTGGPFDLKAIGPFTVLAEPAWEPTIDPFPYRVESGGPEEAT